MPISSILATAAVLAFSPLSLTAQDHHGNDRHHQSPHHGDAHGDAHGDDHSHDHDHDHDDAEAADEMDHHGTADEATGNVVSIEVNGMVCDFCAQSLRRTFERNDAVKSVDISLSTKIVSVTLEDGATLSDEAIEEAVTNAGYALVAISRA